MGTSDMQDPNYNPRNHPDNAHLPNINQPATILGITISMLSIAILAMTLRLWVRIRDRLWGWDDAFVLLAGIASISGDTLVCMMPGDGLGLHYWTLGHAHEKDYFRHIYSTNVGYTASSTFIKLAILFQYLRLFAESTSTTTSNQYLMARRLTFSLVALCSLWGITFFFLAIFPCQPISKNWLPTIPGKCIGWGSKIPNEFFTMFVAHTSSNMFLDLLVLFLPVPFLGMLRLAGKGKAGLITLFILGCIVCAVSVGRVISLCINRAGTVPILDMSYHVPIVYMFSVLEVNIAIITASIPIFWPVIVTLATNKIWVVNEIEVRVDSTSRNSLSSSGEIGLADSGTWKNLDKEDTQRTTHKLSDVLHKAYNPNSHRHKRSNSSGMNRHDSGGRNSHESQRILVPTTTVRQVGSNGTMAQGRGGNDWLVEADRQNTAGTTTTRIATADVPYAQIRKMEM